MFTIALVRLSISPTMSLQLLDEQRPSVKRDRFVTVAEQVQLQRLHIKHILLGRGVPMKGSIAAWSGLIASAAKLAYSAARSRVTGRLRGAKLRATLSVTPPSRWTFTRSPAASCQRHTRSMHRSSDLESSVSCCNAVSQSSLLSGAYGRPSPKGQPQLKERLRVRQPQQCRPWRCH